MKTLLAILIMLQFTEITKAQSAKGYAHLAGLDMYYEVWGNGSPLVLIHGGGSTLESSFGKVIPSLAKKYKIIAVEMQAHGRTKDRNRPLSFEQDADDIAALLEQLHIPRASILGFSNGATTALQVAIRHPEKVERLVLASIITKRSGVGIPGFWEGFKKAHIDVMPQALKDAYFKVSPDPKGLQTMFERDVERMDNFKDIPDEAVRRVAVPALILNSEYDVATPEHSVELYRLLQHGRLLLVPGGHGEWLDAAESRKENNPLPALVLPMVERFLDAPAGQ
jgi:pimeloyl-ACP methyl ester carboxylesterase